jgi:hypothetical protein
VNPIALAALNWKYYGVYIGVLGVYTVLAYYIFPVGGILSQARTPLVWEH